MRKLRSLLVIAMALLLVACGNSGNNANVENAEDNQAAVENGEATQSITVTDLQGRELTFEEKAEKAICIGPGALRLYTYVNGSDGLVGVEAIEKEQKVTRPYLMAYPEITELETIGKGGPMNEPDAELLSSIEPDVVFSMYSKSADELDALQEKIGAKVVSISMGRDSIFDEDLYHSLDIIGQIMGNKERADELVAYMEDIQEDLDSRTESVEAGAKAYIGGIGFKGRQGILSSRSHFGLMSGVNIPNILDDLTEEPNVMLDKEKLLDLDPEVIFLDLDGQAIFEEDMKEDPGFYEKLSAFKNGRVYALMPFNDYLTNVDASMLDMYYMGSVAYPDAFKDVVLEEKAEEIFTSFLGDNFYDEMMELYPKALQEYKLAE